MFEDERTEGQRMFEDKSEPRRHEDTKVHKEDRKKHLSMVRCHQKGAGVLLIS
jgi:hypothetical protein